MAPFSRLESLRRLGLTTQRVHKMPVTYTITSGIQNRLFLFPHELDGIEYLRRPEKSLLLRFRRLFVNDLPVYYDPNYAMNRTTAFHTVREVYSFSVDATIPPAELEACTYAKREPGFKKWTTHWVRVEQANENTKYLAKGPTD